MKSKVDKTLTLMLTAIFALLVFIGFTMMLEVGVGYLWLAMYTIGAYGLAYQVFSYFVNDATQGEIK